jgi:hypothetical protein
MNPFHTLADFVLAFRQAKTAVAAGRDGISISAFAEFEARLLERTRGLQARTKGQRWFDELRIGSVVACPREIKKREPDRPDDIVRVRPNAREKVSLTLRLQLEPTPEFSTVEVLYLWEFGGALEALLDDACVGYRLKRVRTDGRMDKYDRQVYEHWQTAFAMYRDDPVRAASRALLSDQRVLVISTDVTSFFDSIDPSFLLNQQFLARLQDAA